IEVEGMSADRAVRAGAPGEPHVAVDGGGQDKAVVVVGVLADQVDAPRRAHHDFGRRAECLLEGFLNHSDSSKADSARFAFQSCGFSLTRKGRNFKERKLRYQPGQPKDRAVDRKSTRLNSSHVAISYAV